MAFRYSGGAVFYFDRDGNKYIAAGSNLAWRINNPGLVRSHTHFSRRQWIDRKLWILRDFFQSLQGGKALAAWHAKDIMRDP